MKNKHPVNKQLVYEYLKNIPDGKVVTYGQIAEYLGNCNLARTVENILHSNPEGENWKGFLYAEWYDEKPEWSECNGYIDVNVNRPYKSVCFNSKEEFEREYYRLFEELKTKGIIRSASMKINKEWVHSWNL